MKKNVSFEDCYGITHTNATLFVRSISCNRSQYATYHINAEDLTVYDPEQTDENDLITYQVAFFTTATAQSDGYPPAPFLKLSEDGTYMVQDFQFVPEDKTDLDDADALVAAAEAHFFTDILVIEKSG